MNNTKANNEMLNNVPISKRRVGGMRLRKGNKRTLPEKPLITIITATFNAEMYLSDTAQSIRNQDYDNVEWIIADGASRDCTLDVIKKNEDIIDYWISEPDQGIYSAWNKAIRHANGEWVLFLGAGDLLANCNVLSQVASVLSGAYPRFGMVYGKIQLISHDGTPFEEIGKEWKDMKGKWYFGHPVLPVHPEVFHHRSLFEEESFDERMRIAADAKLLTKEVMKRDPLFTPILITKMLHGGISSAPKNQRIMWREIKQIRRDLSIKAPVWHLVSAFMLMQLKMLVYACLPKVTFIRLYNRYRVLRNKNPVPL